jgi:hypothetical protein
VKGRGVAGAMSVDDEVAAEQLGIMTLRGKEKMEKKNLYVGTCIETHALRARPLDTFGF